jgi:branched-chain amino acid transport system permease protein
MQAIAVLAVQSVIIGLTYSTLALGFNIVYRASKSINLAYPAMVLLAAYTILLASERFGFSLLASAASAVAVGFAVGVAVEKAARPLLGKPPIALIAFTIGVMLALKGFTMEAAGDLWSGGSLPLHVSTYSVAGVVVDSGDLLAATITMLALLSVVALHRMTGLGAAMRAVAEDAQGAAAYGIPVTRLTMLSWGLSGAIGAVAALALAV